MGVMELLSENDSINPTDPPPSYRFGRQRRLSGSRSFSLVHKEGVHKPRGPLVVAGRPNGLPHCRLGLSVSRRVGNAVRRNAIKRRLREAFRLLGPTMPAGYDLVVIARPHSPVKTQQYQEWIRSAWLAIDATHSRRRQKINQPQPSTPKPLTP